MAACAGAFPAETSRDVLGNDRAETYRLARTVPWPRRRRRGPSPARLPSRRARFCRESRTSASAVFHVARNPGSGRVTPRFERRGACTRRIVCMPHVRTSTRGANTARGSPVPHARSRSPGSSRRRTIKSVAFRPALNFTCAVARRVESWGCRTTEAPGLHARVLKSANEWRCQMRLSCEMRGTK